MSRPKGSTYDPAAIAWAVNEVSKGRSYRDVSDELAELKVKASHQTVKRWCAEAAQPKEPTPLAKRVAAQRERAEQPPPAVDPESLDFDSTVKRLLADALAEMEQHRLASNPKGVSAAMNTAAGLLDAMRKSEKEKPSDPDVLQFSRKEIDAACEAARQIVAQLTR
jgi:hypothetical protein